MGLNDRNSPLSHRHRVLRGAVYFRLHDSVFYLRALDGGRLDCSGHIKWRKFFGGNDLGSPGLPREA